MRVTALSLSDFRNYERAEVTFAPGFNVILGRNGQGKTNMVEAIAYFASLKSHRVAGDAPLIRAGADAAIMRMRIRARDREVLLEMQLNRGKANRAQLNRNRVQPRELPRWFSVVVFAPEDLSIVRGDPARRRTFLDEAVVLRNPTFIAVLADYERVVRQRTSLLKSARSGGHRTAIDATLEIWDEQLVRLGVQIMLARREVVDLLGPLVRENYRTLVGDDHAPELFLSESVFASEVRPSDVSRETSRAYVSRETLEREFHQGLRDVRNQERDRAVTLLGPHRDDLLLELNGLPVKGYASHGESWSYALSLRLALAAILRDESPAGDPVVILDDVFAELDARRRARLIDAISGYEQVLITAAVEEDLPSTLSSHDIWIHGGEVVSIEEGSSR